MGCLNTQFKREGLGVDIYANGRYYEGEWLNDKRNGRGFELFINGATYLGLYKDNRAHGKGLYTWPNGEMYEGEWDKGSKQGFGFWKNQIGDNYIGEWNRGLIEGHGVHSWVNGDRYEGQWQNSFKHGQGTDIFANGDSYVGQYQFNKPNGEGQYKWRNGASYTGNFVDGKKEGLGKWKKSQDTNSNSYEGNFLADRKNGEGVFKWESGNLYKGSYVNDKRNGYGEMYWNDGSTYKGEWYQGLQHGQGILTMPDGRVKKGLFTNNKFIETEEPFTQLRLPKSQEKQIKVQPSIGGQEPVTLPIRPPSSDQYSMNFELLTQSARPASMQKNSQNSQIPNLKTIIQQKLRPLRIQMTLPYQPNYQGVNRAEIGVQVGEPDVSSLYKDPNEKGVQTRPYQRGIRTKVLSSDEETAKFKFQPTIKTPIVELPPQINQKPSLVVQGLRQLTKQPSAKMYTVENLSQRKPLPEIKTTDFNLPNISAAYPVKAKNALQQRISQVTNNYNRSPSQNSIPSRQNSVRMIQSTSVKRIFRENSPVVRQPQLKLKYKNVRSNYAQSQIRNSRNYAQQLSLPNKRRPLPITSRSVIVKKPGLSLKKRLETLPTTSRSVIIKEQSPRQSISSDRNYLKNQLKNQTSQNDSTTASRRPLSKQALDMMLNRHLQKLKSRVWVPSGSSNTSMHLRYGSDTKTTLSHPVGLYRRRNLQKID